MRLFDELPMNCAPLDRQARDVVILAELIAPPPEPVSLDSRAATWERCWARCLDKFKASGNTDDLVPPYFTAPETVWRLSGDYVTSTNPTWLYSEWSQRREWLFIKYLLQNPEIDEVHEYGCGSGFNLNALAQLCVRLRRNTPCLIGFDRSASAAAATSRVASGYINDLLNPLLYIAEYAHTAVMTMGALEQIGDQWEPFLSMMLLVKPALCLHVEPVLELYDENNLLDWLAVRYHKARGYLNGFLPELRRLEARGKLEMVEYGRTYLGDRHNEGFSLIVWRPK